MFCERCGREISKSLTINSLSRGEVTTILEEAVMTRKVEDIELFKYEGTGDLLSLRRDTLDVIVQIHNKKALERGESKIKSLNRLLRVEK